ncbi:FAD-dependent oxidoreductase [Sphingosinicella terrae]|uniref:FAD-dependent oxidoreductase n=1 Tax=Sphingosinicella terrae TaxID=2172047 RepID=UPI000E0D4EBF|nr:FAD-dependent oxidoreductase [Sphingosinicella terrae]
MEPLSLATSTVDRRRFLGASAAALALPGCAATTASRPAARTGCLPPVLVEESRIIRTLAGLRPYRAAGFVVRREAFADKALVHNYGHGGAGITLSWGSARLAVDLGLAGHRGPVAVIGAGVIGLSTARLAQEAGFAVTLYAKALPPETTSNVAGGQFHPFGHFREEEVTPEWREQFRAATDYSWRRFQIMVGPDYGIEWLPTYVEASGPETPLLPTFPPVNRMLRPDEHPFPLPAIRRYDTLYVETGRYLRQLMRDFQVAGGRIVVRDFATPGELAALPEPLVFNCTGLGARALFGDTAMQPARGQLAVLLPQPEVRYAFTGEAGYMFPRADGIILGGSFELGQWSTEPDPARIARILRRQAALFGSFRCTA